MEMLNRTALAGIVVALGLTGCSQLPDQIETLEQARSAVDQIEQDPLARDIAESRFEQARAALARAEEAYEDGDDLEVIEHDAYIALRNAQIVQQVTAESRARDELQSSDAERSRVLLEAREREAERAVQLAEERAETLEEQERRLEQQALQAAEAEQRASRIAEEARTLQTERDDLEQQLADLEAEQTERGWVVTLSNVLFDFDAAELQPGAEATLDRLMRFLDENPDRNIVIEGHTDSTGPATYNRELSQQRADAVRRALTARGIDAGRIEIRALGEEFPVATNETTAGRQLNRRVEIVFSEEGGRFEGEQRTAAAEPTEEQG